MNKLYFYYSVMNSGKSAHIIMQIHNLQSQGKRVAVFKPELDTRDLGVIKSRALNTMINAKLITKDFDIIKSVKECKPDVIFVDEVNFLSSKNIEDLAEIVDTLNIPVFGYGLLIDYTGKLFEGSKRMIELSDSIRELKAPCAKCNKKATHHLRSNGDTYVFEGDSIIIGDVDVYESVCRTCYMSEKTKAKNNDLS